jgi:hypothetical protein
MPTSKSGIAALVLVAGLAGPVRAQKADAWRATGDYTPSQTAAGLSNYYGMTPSFTSYGLSGSLPTVGGYGYQGFGPGSQFGAHYAASPDPKSTQTPKKPAGPTVNKKPAVKPVSPGNATSKGVMRPRKGL